MKYAIGVVALLVIGGGLFILNTESFQRKVKSIQSEYLGGLKRECVLASINGTVIQKYSGKIDFAKTNEANKILFDLNGKRTIVVVGGGIWYCNEL